MGSSVDDLLDRYNTALGSGDKDTLLQLYSDDAVIWHNYDRKDMTAAEHAESMAAIAANMGGFDIQVRRRRPLVDGGVVQEVDLVMKTPDGERVMAACQLISIEDGRITRFDEYLQIG